MGMILEERYFQNDFFIFSVPYVVSTCLNCLAEAIQICSDDIYSTNLR